MMLVVFALWAVYTIKTIHYTSGQVLAVNQQFLFYSSNSISKIPQFKSWFFMQVVVLLPLISYGLIAICVGLYNQYYLASVTILLYLLLLTAGSAWLYVRLVNKLIDGSKQSILLKLSGKWHKPLFSLFVYNVFDKMKVTYIITKALSWLIVTGVFYLFADVQYDVRVAGIAMLAIIMAHANLIYQEHIFEETYLSFSRNLPYSYASRFLNYLKTYFTLLVPEVIWMFIRFSPPIAFELLLFGLSTCMLLHCLIYWLGVNMDKYIQWLLGLFVVVFWVILFKLTWLLIPFNLGVAYLIFRKRYDRPHLNPLQRRGL